MPYRVRVQSHGYSFVNYFKTKPAANRHARINRGGAKRANKGIHVRVKHVAKIPRKVRHRKKGRR